MQVIDRKRCSTCLEDFDSGALICPADGTALTEIFSQPMLGSVLGDRYQILNIIGEGGMGIVYKAKHILMNRFVAIKIVHPHLLTSSNTLIRFQQEAEAVSCLSHQNIVAVHDFGLTPTAYLVMDFLDGVSLDKLLEDHARLELERSVHIFTQVCDGLAHAHEKGVIHRDLKPGNIMLVNVDGQPVVKIVDFGIAKLLLGEFDESKHLTATGEIFGSPLYMSPEQCRARPLDARSDIYSLGCIMYRAFTGHQPIIGMQLMECLYNHVNIAPKGFDEVCPELNLSPILEAIILKCLEKAQENRFQTMRELKDALESFDMKGHFPEKGLASEETLSALQSNIPYTESPVQEKASKILSPSGANLIELNRAAAVAELSRAASVAEAGFAAFAAEESLAASAAESGRAASAAESARAISAAESVRAASAAEAERAASAAESARVIWAAEVGRAASAAETGRAATAAETGRAASAAEAERVASVAEAERAASAAEAERAASATDPGRKPSSAELGLLFSAAEVGRSASAAEAGRAAFAAESARVAYATEAAFVALAQEAVMAASANEAKLAAIAHEARLVASAAEAGFVAHAAESGRVASAAEAGRAANAAELGRAASAAEFGRAATAAELGRLASAAEAEFLARAAETHAASAD